MMTKVWLVMLLGITIGCGGGTPSDPDTGPAVVTERRVDPGTTGAGITNSTGQHFIVAPASSNRTGILLVFLPGTGGRPDFYTRIARHAAERGHHAVGLAYPNAEAVNDLCASAPSSTCQEEVRVEIITGAPRSSLVSVDVANSIDNRLRALLSWLDRTFPNGGMERIPDEWGAALGSRHRGRALAGRWSRRDDRAASRGAPRRSVCGD